MYPEVLKKWLTTSGTSMSKGAETRGSGCSGITVLYICVSQVKSPFGSCMRSRLEELDPYPAHLAGEFKFHLLLILTCIPGMTSESPCTTGLRGQSLPLVIGPPQLKLAPSLNRTWLRYTRYGRQYTVDCGSIIIHCGRQIQDTVSREILSNIC